MASVKRYDVSAAIEHITSESNVGVRLSQLDPAYHAVVTEVESNGNFEGTILYIPGVAFKELKFKATK